MNNEAWDGSIEKTVNIIEHDDIEDGEVVQTPCTSQCVLPSTHGTATQITMQNVEISVQIMYCLDSPDLTIICHC
jgi:hypothetical protein